MKVWLVSVTERDQYYAEDQSVRKFDSEQSVLSFVGGVATGDYERTAIDAIHSVDLDYPVTVKSLEPTLEKFRIVLREKQ